MNIFQTIFDAQKKHFKTNMTKSLEFRIEQLKKLRESIIKNEENIYKALEKDFRKSKFETYVTEIGISLSEINYTIKHLKKWMKPNRVIPHLINFPSYDYIISEPYGVVLIISPWNYPFLLAISPLIGAIAGGNCAIVKPSEISSNTSQIVEEIISETFPSEYVHCVQGGVETATELLQFPFDKIFFTGNYSVGKIVMQAASKNLIPVTLELGGKNPCIVDANCDVKLSAKRIVWGKFLNAGQTCIAPDYILVHKTIKNEFIDYLKFFIQAFYGEDIKSNPDFPRIINQRHFERLINLIEKEKIIFGGNSDSSSLYIEPTILNNIQWNDKIMQEEVFGAVLPVIEFNTIEEVIEKINALPKPLAIYLFSQDRRIIKRIESETSSGAFVINETISHFINLRLPFGGVGNSGMGNYHGKMSFEAFTHKKAVLKKSTWLDLPLRYPPYGKKLNFVKKVMRWIE